MCSSVSPARGATFAQKSLIICMIFVRNEGSVGKNSKEIEKYFERGPEIQKVIKKHINYNSFVTVGSEGPRHEWLARSCSREFRGFESAQKGCKIYNFVMFVKKERSVGRNSSEIERAKQ